MRALAIGALLLVAVALPLTVSLYGLSLVLLFFLAVTLAQSWNLLSGLTGYFSLGHGVFFGVGAYVTAACVARGGLPFWPSLLTGAGAAFLAALALGLLLLARQVRVAHFAIATLGVNEICRVLVLNSDVLGASRGFTLPPASRLASYYALLALAAVSTALVWRVGRSRMGLGLRAIRQDEEVAEGLGVNTSVLKIRVFLVSAVLPALAGGLMIRYWSYVDPYMAFDLLVSFNMAIVTVLGGIGTVWGPVFGAVVVVGVTELLWTHVQRLHGLLFGLLLFAIVLVAPGGLWSLLGARERPAPSGG